MDIQHQIQAHLELQPEPKRSEMQELHGIILALLPGCRVWFIDGRDGTGRTVCNPNIGYGLQTLAYANGKTREFYQIGLSATTTGLSVYILGLADKQHLARTYGPALGKAKVTGYCIKFKTLKELHLEVLKAAIQDGVEQTRP